MGRPQFFTIDPSHQLARGLVFAGLGNAPGSSRYHDSSAFGRVGTLVNMEPATGWVFDESLGRFVLDFDGSNEYVTRAITITPPFSISIWFNAVSVASNVAGVTLNNPSTANDQYALGVAPLDATKWGFAARSTGTDSGAFTNSMASGGTSAAGIWVHLCGVAQTTTVRDLYVNGQFVATNSRAHTIANTTLDLGRYGDSTPNYFDCSVGDPLLHNRALTLPEIQQLADPSNYMLSGLIKPIGQASNIYDLAGIR